MKTTSSLIFLTLILLLLQSCEKQSIAIREKYFIVNEDTIQIETVRLNIDQGMTYTGLKSYRLNFYSKGVTFLQNHNGFDSIVYNANSYRIWYWLYKPKDSTGYKGKYKYYSGCFPYTNDSAFSFDVAGLLRVDSNGLGSQTLADSGIVIISEVDNEFHIDFEFYSTGWPLNVDCNGKYVGNVQMIND